MRITFTLEVDPSCKECLDTNFMYLGDELATLFTFVDGVGEVTLASGTLVAASIDQRTPADPFRGCKLTQNGSWICTTNKALTSEQRREIAKSIREELDKLC